ncbi:sensor domain-containing diguanylate cyclase [Bacillus sp. AK128]
MSFKKGIFILVLVAAFLFMFNLQDQQGSKTIPIRNGEVDIKNESFSDFGSLNLHGEWEFFWNELIEPDQINNRGQMVSVPDEWSTLEQEDEMDLGYATYRLKINNIDTTDSNLLAIKISKIPSAYKLFVNGELIGGDGVVGRTKVEEKPAYKPAVHSFMANGNDIELVLQVSNFHYRSGAIRGELVLGEASHLLKERERSIAFEMLMFGGLSLLGLYHISLFAFRKKEYIPLFFGLFCILIALRISFIGQVYFVGIFPETPFLLQTKLTYLSFYLCVPFFMLFLYYSYPEETSKLLTKTVAVISGFCSLIVLFSPVSIFTSTVKFYLPYTILIAFYSFFIFIKAYIRKRSGSFITTICGGALLMACLHDLYNYSQNISKGELIPLGSLIFVLGLGLVNSQKLANTFSKAEATHVYLRNWANELEQTVEDRTAELQKANKKLKALSFKDGLTNVANRRYFDERLKEDWNEAIHEQKPISLILLDIDYFKQYNDLYGHLKGDECLRIVAQTLDQGIGHSHATFARYGGEEFAVILSLTDRQEAMKVAQEIKEMIRNQAIEHKESPKGYLTMSIGVATIIPIHEEKPQLLISLADDALYQAKENGKDQVESYEKVII